MRKIILIALTAALVASGSIAPTAARDNEVVSKANFYGQISDGECGLEFTITYRNKAIKGSIAWTDLGWRLRLPESGFVVVDGKLAENLDDVYPAMVRLKGLAVGFWRDGTILPIDLIGLDPKPFVACVEYSLRVGNDLH